MKKNNIALITALYDSNGADLYKEIYFPIIKYSVTKAIIDAKDDCRYGDLSGLKEIIDSTFGIHIPIMVLRQSIRAMAKTEKDVIITLYGKDNYFKVEKTWSVQLKEDIDGRANSVKEAFHNLSIKFTSFIEFNNFSCERNLVDLINACSVNSINLFENVENSMLSEEFTIIARFIHWAKDYDNESYILIEQIVWASLIAGFLKRTNADWDVKIADKTVYYLDTGLLMGILGLSSNENVCYARDLLQLIKSVGAIAYIHPMTENEINHILQSVEQDQGPRPGTAMEFAFASGIKLHDITLIRKNLLEILDKEYGIACVPNMPSETVNDKLRKYLVNIHVKDLYTQRESKSIDMYSEAHDIYMSDYVAEKNNTHGLAEKYGYYFVTANNGLVDFVRPKNVAPFVISSGQVIMNLWLHNAKSNIIKKSVLTELMSRCFAFNQTSARRRLRSFIQNYKNLNLSKEDTAILYTALIDRSNKSIQIIDELNSLDDDTKISTESLKRAEEVVEIARIADMERKQMNNEESQRNEKLKSDIIILQQQIESLKENNATTQGVIDSLSQKLKVSEDAKMEYRAEIDRHTREKELMKSISEVEKQIAFMDANAANSISYVKFWIVIVLETLFVGLAVTLLVLYLITVFDETANFDKLFKTLSLAIIVPLLTVCSHAKNLYIIAPFVAKNNIRKEQLATWKERHEDYPKLIAKKMQLEDLLSKVSSV